MMRHNIIYWLFSLCVVFISCATDNGMSEQTEEKEYEFILSVGTQKNMRMADEVVQANETFRGIQNLYVIPFCTSEANPVTIDDFPLISVV